MYLRQLAQSADNVNGINMSAQSADCLQAWHSYLHALSTNTNCTYAPLPPQSTTVSATVCAVTKSYMPNTFSLLRLHAIVRMCLLRPTETSTGAVCCKALLNMLRKPQPTAAHHC